MNLFIYDNSRSTAHANFSEDHVQARGLYAHDIIFVEGKGYCINSQYPTLNFFISLANALSIIGFKQPKPALLYQKHYSTPVKTQFR